MVIPKTTAAPLPAPTRAWVAYDRRCPLCRANARRFALALRRRRVALLPLQSPWIQRRLQLPETELLREMRLLTRAGEVFGGADACIELARLFWWARPLVWVGRIPAGRRLMVAGYQWLAANRYCLSGACGLASDSGRDRDRRSSRGRGGKTGPWTALRFCVASVPMVILPAAAIAFLENAAPWILMWSLAFTLWLGLKWLTVVDHLRSGHPRSPLRLAGYLLAWPGTDAHKFLRSSPPAASPTRSAWVWGFLKMVLGILLVYGAASPASTYSSLLAGWTGMIGMILTLHFGLFSLIGLAWRSAGVNATPLMQAPVQSTSLSDFWGKRWNTGFSIPARRYLLEPLGRRIGVPGATWIVFLVSGLMHELVISFPAGGGYGLPTGYFLIQALGLSLERTHIGRRIGLGTGRRGRLFALLWTAGPVYWLFHPPFVERVILPFLEALDALEGGIP